MPRGCAHVILDWLLLTRLAFRDDLGVASSVAPPVHGCRAVPETAVPGPRVGWTSGAGMCGTLGPRELASSTSTADKKWSDYTSTGDKKWSDYISTADKVE